MHSMYGLIESRSFFPDRPALLGFAMFSILPRTAVPAFGINERRIDSEAWSGLRHAAVVSHAWMHQ